MKKSRRQFLTAASGVAAATTAGCATDATIIAMADDKKMASPAPAGGNFQYTVNVLDQSTNMPINPSDVHLEPRQSGLDPEDGTGNTPFAVANQGYYDIEVSAAGYYDDALLHKWVASGTTKTIHLVQI